MAKGTRAKKPVKTDPSYRTLKADYYPVQRTVNLGTGAVVGNIYSVDCGRLLSVVNHRLYRQGKTYQCRIDLDNQQSAGAATFEVYVLKDAWYILKAWQAARAAYEKSMADERAHMGDKMAARWEDFRVSTGVTGTNICSPYTYDQTTLAGSADTDGSFSLSRVTLSDGVTQKTFSWGAPGAAQYGILNEFDNTDNTQTNVVTTTGAYNDLDDETQEAAMDDLKQLGQLPPYDQTNFSTSIWTKVAVLDRSILGQPGAGAASTKLSTGFFNAPCGLVIITSSLPNTTLTGELSLTVKAGGYKGVAAMNMGV